MSRNGVPTTQKNKARCKMGSKEKSESRWKRFGRLLKEERMKIIDPRTKEPVSITEIADRVGISRVQWSRWENGGSGISPVRIPMVARALGRTSDDEINEVFKWAGFYVEEEPFQLPPSMRHFVDLPIEIQKDIAKQVERYYELTKQKGRGK
jgi:transcriptional regulator with XRE-family HTH domain